MNIRTNTITESTHRVYFLCIVIICVIEILFCFILQNTFHIYIYIPT